MTQEAPGTTGSLPTQGQTRAAETLALLHAGKIRHVFGTATGWYFWDGTRWKADGSNHARRALRRTLQHMGKAAVTNTELLKTVNELSKSSAQRGALEIASHLDEFATDLDQMDTHPYLLNCANGTLDLQTFELHEHDPDDLLTQVTRAAYVPGTHDEASELWTQFLNTILPDAEVREYLQRLVGYSLIGEVTHHVFPILIGEGGNGKGTFYEAIMWALGDYAAPFDSMLLITTRNDFKSANAPAPALLGLKGKRFVVTSETDEGAKLATAKMKFYTGGDTLIARAMYARTDTVFEPSHTMFMVTNHEPMLSSEDEAAWQRITTIPFNVKIRGTDLEIPGFTSQLKAAKDAILDWAVEGLKKFNEHGLAAPQQVLSRTAAYHAKTDSVATYISSRLSSAGDPKAKIPRSQVWEDWLKWSKAEGVESGKQSDFYVKVSKHYEMGKTSGVWVFRDLVLQQDVLEPELEDDSELFGENVTKLPVRTDSDTTTQREGTS